MRQANQLLRCAILLTFLCANTNAQNEPLNAPSEFEDLAIILIATKSPQERELLLARKKGLKTPELRKALIRHGNEHLMAGRYSTAFEVYDLAKTIAEQIGDKEGIAAASLDIGTVYYFQANYPAALEHYQKARELFREITNDYESAKALAGLALIYKEQRRDAEALGALQQTLKEFTSLGDKEEIGNTLNSIGTIYYGQGNYSAAADAFLKSSEANGNADNIVRLGDALYMQGDYTQALTYYKQSLASLSEKRDPGGIIAALNGAANSAYYQGNYEEALQYYERNVPVQEAQRDKLGVATSLKGIGNVHRSRGEYAAALESYFKSLNISEELKTPTGTTLGSIGLVRALQGDYARALDYYQKALTEFEGTANKIEMARVLSLIGNVYYTRGSYESAIGSYRRGLALREQMDDKSGQGDILAGMGTAFLRQKNYSEALDSYQKALALFDSIGNKERMADVLTRVADTFLLQADYAKGLSAAESAVSLARQLDLGDVLWYAEMLTGKAQRGLDHAAQAYQRFSEAISEVESLRARPPSVLSGEHNSYLPYLSAIDLLMSQHRPGEAFDYAERAKSQYLFELLRTSNAAPNKGLSSIEQSDEQRLTGEAISLELQVERESQLRTSSETRSASLRERLRQTRATYADFRQKVYVAHPHLKIDRAELAPLTLNEMRSLVPDSQTALLEYTITENNTYLFVLTAERTPSKKPQTRRPPATITLKVYPLDIKNNELALRVRQFEEQLSSRADGFEQSALELYDLLVKPAGDQLVLKTKLVVVPDGVLWALPFEALQSADDHYLVDQMEVAYAPSLSALRDMRKQRAPLRRANSTLLAFGNPLLSKEFTSRIELAFTDTKLESSSQQEAEITQVGTTYGSARSRLFVGAVASEERFKLEAPRANILHLATPTLLDDTSPLSSFVGLSPGAGKQDEGFLQAREIMNLQTTARLVVLSDAQHTGSFPGLAGLGLSWSWFVAGSTATMLTRWEIKSPSVTHLMSDFYSRMKPGLRTTPSRASALRQSVISLRRSLDYHHPYYWASFAIIGDAR